MSKGNETQPLIITVLGAQRILENGVGSITKLKLANYNRLESYTPDVSQTALRGSLLLEVPVEFTWTAYDFGLVGRFKPTKEGEKLLESKMGCLYDEAGLFNVADELIAVGHMYFGVVHNHSSLEIRIDYNATYEARN